MHSFGGFDKSQLSESMGGGFLHSSGNRGSMLRRTAMIWAFIKLLGTLSGRYI